MTTSGSEREGGREREEGGRGEEVRATEKRNVYSTVWNLVVGASCVRLRDARGD